MKRMRFKLVVIFISIVLLYLAPYFILRFLVDEKYKREVVTSHAIDSSGKVNELTISSSRSPQIPQKISEKIRWFESIFIDPLASVDLYFTGKKVGMR